MRTLTTFFFLFCAATITVAQTLPGVKVESQPAQAYIERRDGTQLVNFDLVVENNTAEKISLVRLEVSAFDKRGALQARKFLDTNGINPNVLTVSNREIEPHTKTVIYNPFFAWEPMFELARLDYALEFQGKDGKSTYTAAVSVAPVPYQNKVRLMLPLRGRFLVHDGHDALAHHRRWNFWHPAAQQFGLTSNSARYSYDFTLVDEKGRLYKTDGKTNEDWYSYNAPVYASGPGKIVATDGHWPDSSRDKENLFNPNDLLQGTLALFGNHVIIDHGNGEFSIYGHLRQGSVKVKVGDLVRAGDMLATMGMSGSANNPHLHYQLNTEWKKGVEGLPSYFHDFKRVLGSRKIAVQEGQADTGDIVENGGR